MCCMLLSVNVNIQMIWAWSLYVISHRHSPLLKDLLQSCMVNHSEKVPLYFFNIIMIYTWLNVVYWKCISKDVQCKCIFLFPVKNHNATCIKYLDCYFIIFTSEVQNLPLHNILLRSMTLACHCFNDLSRSHFNLNAGSQKVSNSRLGL